MSSHRYTGEYAGTVMVGESTVPVAPGDFVELSKDDLENEDNAMLVDEGQLVDADALAKDLKAADAKAEKEAAATTSDDTKEVKK